MCGSYTFCVYFSLYMILLRDPLHERMNKCIETIMSLNLQNQILCLSAEEGQPKCDSQEDVFQQDRILFWKQQLLLVFHCKPLPAPNHKHISSRTYYIAKAHSRGTTN